MASTHSHSNSNYSATRISNLVVAIALFVFLVAPVGLTLMAGI